MSRSIRKYSGFSHTQSDTKQGKFYKHIRHKETRRKMNEDSEAYEPLGRKCHKCNRYDKDVLNGAPEEWLKYKSVNLLTSC